VGRNKGGAARDSWPGLAFLKKKKKGGRSRKAPEKSSSIGTYYKKTWGRKAQQEKRIRGGKKSGIRVEERGGTIRGKLQTGVEEKGQLGGGAGYWEGKNPRAPGRKRLAIRGEPRGKKGEKRPASMGTGRVISFSGGKKGKQNRLTHRALGQRNGVQPWVEDLGTSSMFKKKKEIDRGKGGGNRCLNSGLDCLGGGGGGEGGGGGVTITRERKLRVSLIPSWRRKRTEPEKRIVTATAPGTER